MSFITQYGSRSIVIMDPDLSAGTWQITAFPSITTSPYDLDVGTVVLCKLAPLLQLTDVAREWISKAAPGCSNMYVTAVSTTTLSGGFCQATLTIKGVCCKKYCKKTISLNRKEMTVSKDGDVASYSAPVPAVTFEYLTGPNISPEPRVLPPNPPGIVFSGKSKTNSPNGWVRMDATSDKIEGTPFQKMTETYQWVYPVEPANGK